MWKAFIINLETERFVSLFTLRQIRIPCNILSHFLTIQNKKHHEMIIWNERSGQRQDKEEDFWKKNPIGWKPYPINIAKRQQKFSLGHECDNINALCNTPRNVLRQNSIRNPINFKKKKNLRVHRSHFHLKKQGAAKET